MKKITPYYIWFAFSLTALTFIGITAIKLPFRGDERHIVETIKLFSDNFSFSTIKDYPEVTPPFFYMFYALWAKIFSGSIESLRMLMLIISFLTWQLVYYLFSLFVKKGFHAILLSLLVIINQYFFGTSIFVFTDMLTILLILAAVISFIKDQLILYTIFGVLALLCRQYAVIIPLAVVVYSLLDFRREKLLNIKNMFASVLMLLPLLGLFVIWQNISPVSGIEKWIVVNSSFYNIDYINTYLTFSVVYIFPLIFIFLKKIRFVYPSLLIALLITLILSIFPVKTSAATLKFTDYQTVGFVHQAFTNLFGYDTILLKLILFGLLLAGCYVNAEVIRSFYLTFKAKSYKKELIFILLWILFLLIMPISYQVWEKYLTMILPFLILSIYLVLVSPKPERNNRATI